MRVVSLDETSLIYLQDCVASSHTKEIVFGIIIGQTTQEENYVIVHLARNHEEEIEGSHPREFLNIKTQFLINQWLSAIRMIPGSFTVLGIFVCANGEEMLEDVTFQTATSVLSEVHDKILQSQSFVAEEVDHDFILLAYSRKADKIVCKSYSHYHHGFDFEPLDCQLIKEPFQWHMFTCNCELDEIFPILSKNINVDKEIQQTITSLRNIIHANRILGQNESVNDDLSVQQYANLIKAGNNQNKLWSAEEIKVTVSLSFMLEGGDNTDAIMVRLFGSTLHFLGSVSSRVFCGPHNLMKDVKRYIRFDIVRSVISRIQIYCDSIDETAISTSVISRPPRRIYFKLQRSSSPILFSEYISRNESLATIITNVYQVLSYELKEENIIDDVESLNFDESISDTIVSPSVDHLAPHGYETQKKLTQSMYILGIFVSLVVLLASVCLNYILEL